MASRLLPILALALSTSTAVAQPTVSAPAFLPGGAALGASPGAQQNPGISGSDDGTTLVVWSDARTGIAGSAQTDLDVLGVRLDAAGNRLDATPFVIAGGFGDQRAPNLSWNGQDWLVLWEAQVPTEFYYSYEVRAARVSKQGLVLDAVPLAPLGIDWDGLSYRAVALGSTWVVVSAGLDFGNTGIWARRVNADGTYPDPGPVQLIASTSLLAAADVEVAGGELLITWFGSIEGGAQRFGGNLAPIGSPFSIPGTSIVSSGSSYYVIWQAGNLKLGSPMSLSGQLALPAGAVLSNNQYTAFEMDGSWDGAQWWIGWRDAFFGLRYSRVNAAGAILDPGGKTLDTVQEDWMSDYRFAALPGGGTFVAWMELVGSPLSTYQVYVARIAPSAVASPRIIPGVSAPSQIRADVVPGGTGSLVTFLGKGATSSDIAFQRLDGSGNVLDPNPVVLHTANNVSAPRAAFNGSIFLVVWADNGFIYGKRVRPDGTSLDAAPRLLMQGFAPDVAALGDTFCVVGTDYGISIQYIFPFAVLVGADGSVLTDRVALGNSYASAPHVEAVGSRFFALWNRNYSHDDPQGQAEGAFVDLTGAATPSFVIAYNGFVPSAAVSPNEVMIVFRTNSVANANNDVAYRRMLYDGTFPAAQAVLSAAPYRQMFPTVAWSGSEFVAAWEDQRNAATFFDVRTDVYGARISAGGMLLDPGAFPIEDADAGAVRPALGALSGAVYAATGVFRAEAPYASMRLSLRSIDGCAGGSAPLGIGCGGSGGFVPSLAAAGCPVEGGTVELALANALGGAPALLVLGGAPVALNLPGACTLHAPPAVVVPLTLLGAGPGFGHTSLAGVVPAGAGAATITAQFVVLDAGNPFGVAASNAVVLTVP